YQRELLYKHNDGSYSAFGESDATGNTWLTAFVLKSFGQARPYISIDEKHLEDALRWLQHHQLESGCFRSVGKLLNNALQGGVVDELSLSAYITAALLELGQPLRRKVKALPSPYGIQAPSAEVEMTAYVLLAYLSLPNVSAADMATTAQIVRWLSKQQNPYGGFASTQLEKQLLVKRLEVQNDQVTLYLDQVSAADEGGGKFHLLPGAGFPCEESQSSPSETVRLLRDGHYVVVSAAELYHPHTGTVSVHLSDLNETVRVSVRLERGDGPSAITLLEREVREPRLHETVRFQVPAPSGGQQEVAELHVSIRGDALQFSERKKVLLRALQPGTFVQTDKAVYKPGQTVKFRIVSLDKDFVPSTRKVKLAFSQDRALPGSELQLRVQAAPGSLCAVRAVDQSVLLRKPEAELSVDTVYNLLPDFPRGDYPNAVREPESCHPLGVPGALGPPVVADMIPGAAHVDSAAGTPVSNARPVPEPGTQEEAAPRPYFPEMWLWDLVPVGEGGSKDLPVLVPDTITEWKAGMFCTAEVGFGLSPTATFTAVKPFFVELALPYSVIRGEAFALKATVFNYLRQCIKGGMVDELSVSAYITAALLELGQPLMLHWWGKPSSYGNEAPSAEAMTAYVLLAYLSLPNVSAADMTTATQIVRWLSKQQNLYKDFAPTQLEKQPLVKRLEVQNDQVTLYLDQLTEEAESFTFSLEQDFPVKNLRAAPVRLYDYETGCFLSTATTSVLQEFSFSQGLPAAEIPDSPLFGTDPFRYRGLQTFINGITTFFYWCATSTK
ncbi:hypothetical protein KIL84_002245, partial [Mauremys mutica]